MKKLTIKIKSLNFIFVFLLLLIFTFNALYKANFQIRGALILLSLFFFYLIIKNSSEISNNVFKHFFSYTFIFIFLLIVLFRDLIFYETISEISIFICIIIGLVLSKFKDILFKILIFFLTLCFFVQLFEYYYLENYLIKINDYKFELNRLQGIFSYSKETAGFTASMSFLIYCYYKIFSKNRDFYYWLFLFISLGVGLLSGARVGFFIPLSILIFSILNKIQFLAILRGRLKNSIFKILLLIFVFLLFLYFSGIIDLNYIYSRSIQAFDFNSSGNLNRRFFWITHLSLFWDKSILIILFGAGTSIKDIIGNGAENLYITIFTQFGILGLGIYLYFLIYFFSKLKKDIFNQIISLIILSSMFFSNIMSGWSDGIIFWASIGLFLEKKKLFH
tara:strand:- start:674 stop:1846 length:1173 start_codon:yes stop_codon:yes gene_type:complete